MYYRFFCLVIRPPPSPTLFPYTTLFRSGIMHYDRNCGCTQGLLLADYLKALLTGENLPPDLAAQAATSQLLRAAALGRSEEHTSELQSLTNLVCRLLLEKKKKYKIQQHD